MGKKQMNQSSDADAKSPSSLDGDATALIAMAQELKNEGNKLFQKRDHEGAMAKFDQAIKCLPSTHVEVAHLRSSIAACYMQMGLEEFPKAINECNLALEVCPKYSKALLKRAKCYEAFNRLDLAYRDVSFVLNTEPNNLTALEISQRVRRALERKGVAVDVNGLERAPEYAEPPTFLVPHRDVKERLKKKKSSRWFDVKKVMREVVVIKENENEEEVVEVKEVRVNKEEGPSKTVKLAFGVDIRWAKLPGNCSIEKLREIVESRFPGLKDFIVKYKDQEGDLVTITATEELRWAEASSEQQGSIRLYVIDVGLEQDPSLEVLKNGGRACNLRMKQHSFSENGSVQVGKEELAVAPSYIYDWIIEFARLFKNQVGFDSDAYLNLHQLGMKLYSEAIEDIVTSEEAQDVFDTASEKFQEMAALALLNWGNVHLCKVRKRVYLTKDASEEAMLEEIKVAYDWAQNEYMKARQIYEEALIVKPDFYEAFLAMGLQQFEQARLSWYYAIGNKVDLATWPSTEVFELFNSAEDNIQKGKNIWETVENHRLNELSKPSKIKIQMQEMGLSGLFTDTSPDEVDEQAATMVSQINLLLGTILYERSILEFKLGLPQWEYSVEAAYKEFELAGASATDLAVMRKNHCSHETVAEGMSFRIDEIVQAWNEIYNVKKWKKGIQSFRLEPLFRRQVPKLLDVLQHV